MKLTPLVLLALFALPSPLRAEEAVAPAAAPLPAAPASAYSLPSPEETGIPAPELPVPAPVPTKAPAPVAGAKPAGTSKNNPTILDFEADVIEGEKKTPDLFIQLGAQQQGIQGVVYDRRDFNDFHAVELKWRPKYLEMRAPGKRK